MFAPTKLKWKVQLMFVLSVDGCLHIEVLIDALLWNAYSPFWMITKIIQVSLHKNSIHKFTFLCCLVGKHAAAYVHVRVLWVTQLNHTKQIHLPDFFHRKCIIQGRFCWNSMISCFNHLGSVAFFQTWTSSSAWQNVCWGNGFEVTCQEPGKT